jgi:hypothetical protein
MMNLRAQQTGRSRSLFFPPFSLNSLYCSLFMTLAWPQMLHQVLLKCPTATRYLDF